jgi:hypothetical protein
LKIVVWFLTGVLVLWMIIIVIYYGNIFINKYQVEKNTAKFLDRVIANNMDAAPDFAGSYSELEQVEKILAGDGFQLVGYERIQPDFDDGCVCTGHVDLVLKVEEKPLKVRAVFTVKEGNRPNQICIMTPLRSPEISQWNRYACGAGF